MTLEQEIYTQLLELYMLDLENENKLLDLTVKAFQVTKSFPAVPSNPYPPQNPPWNPYPIWCMTDTSETYELGSLEDAEKFAERRNAK